MATEKRLIDANALMEVYRKVDYNYPGEWSLRDILSFLEIAPTVDAVEVVRCKECKHYKTITCFCGFHCVTEDWYCGNGERKDND